MDSPEFVNVVPEVTGCEDGDNGIINQWSVGLCVIASSRSR